MKSDWCGGDVYNNKKQMISISLTDARTTVTFNKFLNNFRLKKKSKSKDKNGGKNRSIFFKGKIP